MYDDYDHIARVHVYDKCVEIDITWSEVEAMLDGALTPSATPALLGPITESGRVGWACKPEQAAASGAWQNAELPRP